jgi:hypothetical protein
MSCEASLKVISVLWKTRPPRWWRLTDTDEGPSGDLEVQSSPILDAAFRSTAAIDQAETVKTGKVLLHHTVSATEMGSVSRHRNSSHKLALT